MIASLRRIEGYGKFTPPAVPEEEILREQVRQIYRLAPIGFMATVLNSIIVFLLMKDVTPGGVMHYWEGAILAVTAGRVLLVLAFSRVQGEFSPAPWARRYLIGIALIGIAWGSVACIPFTFSLTHQVFLAYVIGGMAAGGTSTFGHLRHGCTVFSVTTILPLAVHFFLMGDNFHYGMGGMGIAYLLCLSYIGHHNYMVNRESLLLRHENRDMIEVLTRANQEVAELNQKLKEHHRHLARTVEDRTADLVRANDQLKREIEERKEVERALVESRERLVLAQRAGRVGVFDWDMQTGRLIVTAELEELYGLHPGALRDYEDWARRVYPPDLANLETMLSQWKEERVEQVEFEYRIVNAEGTRRWIEMTAEITYAADGAPLRMIGTNVDITERKEGQQTLKQAKEAAEAASLAKSQFLANMTHEMRTPLAGVLGMIRLVLDSKIGAEDRDLLEMARRSAESLMRLIEDVLDFSRVEAGVMKYERKLFRIDEVVRSAVEVVSLSARERGIALSWRIPESVPAEVEGDPGRVRQVLVNLVGNAVKFTERGTIDVTVRPFVDEEEKKSNILFSVKDTGVGIATEEQERIFENFTQLDASLTKRYSGTGLGLALSRQIVAQMGGRIWVESSAGVGSTFYFTIPTPSS